MATIYYEITDGNAPFTASISPAVAPDNHHAAIGTYYFTNIPDGEYTITITDACGFIEIPVSVDCTTTTSTEELITTSTTEVATTTTSTIVPCDTPQQYIGGTSYPTSTEINLSVDLGYVRLNYRTGQHCDRFIIKYNGDIVLDTGYEGGYIDGANCGYEYGGYRRDTLNTALNGKEEPLSKFYNPAHVILYPIDATIDPGETDTRLQRYINAGYNVFPNVIESDGYPRVNMFIEEELYNNKCFYKDDAENIATVEVYAPLPITGWFFTLYCPVIDLPEECETTTTTTSEPVTTTSTTEVLTTTTTEEEVTTTSTTIEPVTTTTTT